MRLKPPGHPHPGRAAASPLAARPPGLADRRVQHAAAQRQHAVLVPAAVPLALLKLMLPFAAVRRRVDPLLNGIATAWVSCHSCWFERIQREPWDAGQYRPALRGLVPGQLQSPVLGGHLRAASHVEPAHSAAEILKQQLIYVPVIGLAWWALDFRS